jgi:hypothetical protein
MEPQQILQGLDALQLKAGLKALVHAAARQV